MMRVLNTCRLKLVTMVWLLRCTVLRGTPMASAIHFKKLTGYVPVLKQRGIRLRTMLEGSW
jgi:hypothetical protein